MNNALPNAPFEPLTERELDILRLLAQGLSDREIGQASFIAPATVKWYNKQIYSKLDVHSRTQAVARARALGLLEATRSGPDQGTPPTIHGLPAQTASFVGREREIEDVGRLLAAGRLVTLTGPPGTGKTRLAMEAVQRIAAWYRDGVYFIDLIPVNRPEGLPAALAQALGIIEVGRQPLRETLKRVLNRQHLLLVLDNFEHIVAGASVVADLLAAAPRLSVLVTSREVLRIYGEHEYRVRPLALPDQDDVRDEHRLGQVEATRLFVQRARAVKPGFEITPDNAAAVAELCTQLDGLPLAIELAAARVRMLPPRELVARLTQRFTVLTSQIRDLPPRHRTLQATIDWSYHLLDETEKALFARLSVFRGGFTVESALAVCAEDLDIDIPNGVESLLTKSLLTQEDGADGTPRFSMLETLHAYARERLEASGNAAALHKAHAVYFRDLAAEADPELRGGQRQAYWFSRLRTERNNLRGALSWALDGTDVELGVQLAGAIAGYWYDEGLIGEGIRWTEKALSLGHGVPDPLRAKLLGAAGELCFAQAAYDKGRQLAEQALSAYRALGDQANTAWAMVVLAAYAEVRPEARAAAHALCEEALAIFREQSHQPGMARALLVIGELARLDGEYEQANQAYKASLDLYRVIGDRRRQGIVVSNLGDVAALEGDTERAKRFATQAVELLNDGGSEYFLAFALAGFAGSVTAEGNAERAARILGAAEIVLENLGVGYQPADRPTIRRYAAKLRAQLGNEACSTAWAEGRAMSLQEAVAYALEGDPG